MSNGEKFNMVCKFDFNCEICTKKNKENCVDMLKATNEKLQKWLARSEADLKGVREKVKELKDEINKLKSQIALAEAEKKTAVTEASTSKDVEIEKLKGENELLKFKYGIAR